MFISINKKIEYKREEDIREDIPSFVTVCTINPLVR